MFFSGLLAKRNENTFQSISLKGMGWEEEGEQEAQRLQQSTDALFSSRQKALGIKVPSAHLAWATYFQVSGDPKCQQLNVCREGTQERETGRGGESSAPLAADKPCWCQQGHLAEAPSWCWPCPRGCVPVLHFPGRETWHSFLCSRSASSQVFLKKGNESICIFLLKQGGMFLLTLYCALRFAPGLLVG